MVQAAQMRDELDRLAIIDRVTEGLSVDGELLREKAIRTISDEATIDDVRDALIKRSLEMMDEANPRSEERRVGKECRARWSREESKKRKEKTGMARKRGVEPSGTWTSARRHH